jgi:hypothetical protein
MRRLAAALACFAAVSGAAGAETPGCRLFPRPQLDMSIMKARFVADFCGGKACEAKWANAQKLIELIAADENVANVGTAAFLLATAEVETGDFSPDRVEVKGKANEKRDYFQPDAKTGQTYYGRGWVQLTRIDAYQRAEKELGVPLVAEPDRALEPEVSYRVLHRAVTEGWLEYYRGNANGTTATSTPIRLEHFISADDVDYAQARAVINANCTPKPGCVGFYQKKGDFGFVPPAVFLDASDRMQKSAHAFERAFCLAAPKP